MASPQRRAMESPSTRADLVRKRVNILSGGEIVYVDRLGPRILHVPPKPTAQLSRETLRELDKGNLAGNLSRGTRFLANRMTQCPEITIATSGQYTVKKPDNNSGRQSQRSYTVKTLNVWTGQPGNSQEDRDIADLIFYSIGPDLLPSYHSWRDEKLERREVSLEYERQQELLRVKANLDTPQKSLGAVIEEQKAKNDSIAAEKASNDPENMLRFQPDISPSAKAWEGVEEYFKWILEYERQENPEAPKIHRILEEEFLESQRLLAIPATNSGYRARIQDENTEKYHEALRTRFQDKPDNLVTKLTMLCFGLPIEPLTLINVKFGGGSGDVPSGSEETQKEVNGLIVEQILWSEKPLEFLDCYNERSYGYPMIRSVKRKYDPVDAETREEILEQAKQLAKNPYVDWGVCGTSQMEDFGLDLHLRGGAADAKELRKKKLWVFTEVGKFRIEDEFFRLATVLNRVFRLESDRSWSAFQWDLVPIQKTDTDPVINLARTPMHFRWTRTKKNHNQPEAYENFMIPHRMEKNEWALRVRLVNEKTIRWNDRLDWRDPLTPEDHPSLVNLAVKGTGISYWYLPTTKPQGVNVLEETFRNAIECLIPYHRFHDVEWDIAGQSRGRMRLVCEGPSAELWDAVQKALGSPGRVQVDIKLIPDKPSSEVGVKILMPGYNGVGWYDRLLDYDMWKANTRGFEKIRAFASKRIGQSTALRLWTGVENYDSREDIDWRRSVVLPAKYDAELEQDIWMVANFGYTWDCVFVRPDFEEYCFICIKDQAEIGTALDNRPSIKLSPDEGFITLQRFRGVVSQLLPGFNSNEDYIAIEQPRTHQTFIVGPGMVDGEWRLQIFDWLISSTVIFRRHEKCPPLYAIDMMDGPFGPITNYSPSQRALDRAEVLPMEPNTTLTKPLQPTEKAIEGVITSQTTPFGGTTNLAKWKDWRAKQDVEEQRRIEAYSTNESIYRDEREPHIPKFGPAFEAHIPIVGPKFPVIFTGLATATDNVEREKATRELLNIVLGRQDFCGVCEVALPAGAHNLAERELHFQSHRDKIREAQEIKAKDTNDMGPEAPGSGPQGTVASNTATGFYGSAEEVFYCEYCGKTTAQFERENNGRKHGPACAHKETYNSIPQYCQYCCLNFWRSEMTDASVKSHVENCANNRRVSPRGQIHLYQKLLSKSVGRGQPNGNSTCHFSSCDQIFDSGTTNLAMALHFWNHVDNKDDEKQPCIFPQCLVDLSNLTTPEVVKHLTHHEDQPGQPDQPDPKSNICPIKNCGQNFDSWSQKNIVLHLTTHTSKICVWPGCKHIYPKEVTEASTIEHIESHFKLKCFWPNCDFVFERTTTPTTIEVHMRSHGLGQVLTAPGDTPVSPEQDADNDNNIPKSLRDSNPGKNFYCPACLVLVSGKNPSPCKRHRGGDCNIQGHSKWLILTQDEVKAVRDKTGKWNAITPGKKTATTKKHKATPVSRKSTQNKTRKASEAGYAPGSEDSVEKTSDHKTGTRSITKRKGDVGLVEDVVQSPTKKRKN